MYLGGALEMRQVVFGSTPSLCSFGSDGAIFQIDFVSNNDELKETIVSSFSTNLTNRKVVGITWRRLDQELIPPRFQRFECVWRGCVVNEDAAIGSAVECNSERL